MFDTKNNLQELEGTIQCTFTFPFRPKHKRKNCFVDVSIIPEQEIIFTDKNIKFKHFHCGENDD